MGKRLLWGTVFIGAAIGIASCGNDSDTDADGTADDGPEPPPAGHPENASLAPTQRCPGSDGCEASEDLTLKVGAAAVDITPVVDHVAEYVPSSDFLPGEYRDFNLIGGDKCVPLGSCDHGNPDEFPNCPRVDPQKCTWIAGFGIGRAATGVADPNWSRCVALEQGNTKIGLCVVDNVGWFYNEVQRMRDELDAMHPSHGFDYISVSSTHVHQTQDTMGIWGPTDGESGVKREYNAMTRTKTIESLMEASAKLVPVKTEFGASKVDGHIAETDPAGHQTAAFVSDVRDPVVIDNELRTIRFISTADESTVATLINFTAHPEYADDENTLTSSDFPHTLREGVEKGLDVRDAAGNVLYQADGVGGVALFFNGALGGQVGPGAVRHIDFDGTELPAGIERAYSAGRKMAAYALEAIRVGSTTVEAAPIGFRAREFYTDVVNVAFHIAIGQQLFDRDGEFYDPARQLGPENVPALRSQIAVVDIGMAEMVTVPGELHAELLLASADGVTALDDPFIFTPPPFHLLNDPSVPAPMGNPDCGSDGVSRCSVAPPIDEMDRSKVIDLARDPVVTYKWVLGLTPDTFGYIVPSYDFVVDEQNPYLEEPPSTFGDHYEETNSVGTNVQDDFIEPILQLLRSRPAIVRE